LNKSNDTFGPLCPACSAHVPWSEVSVGSYHWCPSCGTSVRINRIYEWCVGAAWLVWYAVIMRWSGFDLPTAFWLLLPAIMMFNWFLRPTLRRLVPPTLTFGDEAAKRLP